MSAQFKCCGVSRNGAKGYTIYRLQNSQNFGNGKPQVPESCCVKQGDNTAASQCASTPQNADLVHQDVSLMWHLHMPWANCLWPRTATTKWRTSSKWVETLLTFVTNTWLMRAHVSHLWHYNSLTTGSRTSSRWNRNRNRLHSNNRWVTFSYQLINWSIEQTCHRD